MGSESVGSFGPPAERPSPFREEHRKPQNTPAEPYPGANVCFSCKQEGHWYKDCPYKTKPSPGSPKPLTVGAAAAGGQDYPEMQCPCGRGVCIVLTSRTERNPGRDFYRCPVNPVSEKCKFFLWCDMGLPSPNSPMKPGQHCSPNSPMRPGQHCSPNSPMKPGINHQDVTDPPYPMCSCGAGRCRLLTMADGENAGRKYFGCTIKKGQGACSHFQWYDGPAIVYEQKKNHEGVNKVPRFALVFEEPKEPEAEGGEAAKANDGINLEEAKVPAAPVLSPKTLQANNPGLSSSPMKRLSLTGGSPAKPGKCFKCKGDGHWMNQCGAYPTDPCFKCGKFGHWKNNCTA